MNILSHIERREGTETRKSVEGWLMQTSKYARFHPDYGRYLKYKKV